MKKYLLIIVLYSLTIIHTSCNKQKLLYSCNPQLNQWVSSNLSDFSSFTRADLVRINSLDTEMAIYASLSPEQKYNIWMDKFSLVLDSFSLTGDERNHIQSAMNHFRINFWQCNDSLDNLRPWMESWADIAKQNFGWDSVRVFLIAETWLLPSELNRIALKYNNSTKIENKPNGASPHDPPLCECRYTVACQWFVEVCAWGGCNENFYKCGLAGTSRCKGLCAPNTSTTTNNQGEVILDENKPTYVH